MGDPPGSIFEAGDPRYGKGHGHEEIQVRGKVIGQTSMAVGACICCFTCCPCGFCIPLDDKKVRVWVVDPPGGAQAPAPQMMGMPTAQPSQSLTAQPSQILKVQCGGPCGQVIQVMPAAAGLVEFVCPHCQTRNRITYTPGPVQEESFEYPPSWRVHPPMGQSSFASLGNDTIRIIQKLVKRTWKDITTRDRVSADGKKYAKPPKLRVVQVQQNCNPQSWANYVRAKRQIASSMGASPQYSCLTTQTLAELGDSFAELDPSLNEAFLFHGTKPSACENICKSDFMVKMAGSNAGTLYGSGLYFAECSSKSDEYAADDTSGIYSGLYAMLLCRVVLGRVLYTDEVTPNVDNLTQRVAGLHEFDSVLGDREKARGTYREFVVFNNDQAYPEYVILYRRETEEDESE